MDRDDFISQIADVLLIAYRLNRMFSQGVDDACLDSLSPTQFQTLIMMHQQGVLTMGQLADAMMVTRQQLTKIVDALVEKDMVIRGADPDNRRHVMVRISEEGDRFLHRSVLARTELFFKMLEELGEGEAQRMQDAVIAIKDILIKLSGWQPSQQQMNV